MQPDKQDQIRVVPLNTRQPEREGSASNKLASIIKSLRAINDVDDPSLERALRDLGLCLTGADELTRRLVREKAISVLKEKVNSPAKVVDAALAMSTAADANVGTAKAMVLRSPEPWPEPVDGGHLLDSTWKTLTRYIVLPSDAEAITIALWILHTYCIDATYISPRLLITSPEKRCGKTKLLDLLERLVQRPISAANLTAAVTFRAIEAFHPTLLVDEADTFLRDNDELRGVINAGYRRGPGVPRCVGDDYLPRLFDVFGPLAIAGIGRMPGTIEDRSVVIRMRRRKSTERCDRLLPSGDGTLDELRRKCARFAADELDFLRRADPAIPEVLNDRAGDSWRPLFAIADAAGGECSRLAEQAALELSGDAERGSGSRGVMLLSDIREFFRERDQVRAWTRDIVGSLLKLEERPWCEYRSGKPITPRQLGGVLSPFGVSSRDLRIEGRTAKGYLRTDFEDAFDRYLDPEKG